MARNGILFSFSALCAFCLLSSGKAQFVTTCGPNGGVRLTETTIDSGVATIDWMGRNNSVVYLSTQSNTLYRSGDEGASWVDQSSRFGGTQIGYISTTSNESKIYFMQGNSPFRIWTTEDEGVTYKARDELSGFKSGFSFFYIFPHPREQDIAIGIGPNQKCYTGTSCSFDAYVTFNFGYNWALIDTYIEQIGWGLEDDNGVIYVLYTSFQDKTGYQQNKPIDSAFLTKIDVRNLNADRPVLYSNVNALFKTPENISILFLAERNPAGGMNLLISEDDGQSWMPTLFPLSLNENSYTVLDVSDGAVFMNVQHEFSSSVGNVYVSDYFTSRFALSLKNNKRLANPQPFWGGADFAQVEGLDGVYVANVFDGEVVNTNNKLQTVISFDMGGEWRRLVPPANDSLGRPTVCDSPSQCYLNLFGAYENAYGRFYSVPNSVGLLIGTGNIGNYLKVRDTDINTYFSRDAGWTWQEIFKGSQGYEIADHGSLIILADNVNPTSNLSYTWNEGLSFESCRFTTLGNVEVENIVVEPSFTSQKFILYGQRGNRGVVIQVDFTGIHETVCRNPDRAGQPDSDYELWSPSDVGFADVTKDCLLGTHTTYTRKKREARCSNPQQYETIVSSNPCACVREDYACDYCFEPTLESTCKSSCPSYNPSTPPDLCFGTYPVTQGYRLIPGDKCKGGLDYRPVQTPCPTATEPNNPDNNDNGLPGVAIVLILLVVVLSITIAILGSACVVVKLQKPAFLYDKLKDIKLFQSNPRRSKGESYSPLSLQKDDLEDSPFLENE